MPIKQFHALKRRAMLGTIGRSMMIVDPLGRQVPPQGAEAILTDLAATRRTLDRLKWWMASAVALVSIGLIIYEEAILYPRLRNKYQAELLQQQEQLRTMAQRMHSDTLARLKEDREAVEKIHADRKTKEREFTSLQVTKEQRLASLQAKIASLETHAKNSEAKLQDARDRLVKAKDLAESLLSVLNEYSSVVAAHGDKKLVGAVKKQVIGFCNAAGDCLKVLDNGKTSFLQGPG